MAIRRKGAAPWSIDYDSGLADAPVNSHPGVEADQVQPVIDAGFIDAAGNWQIDKISNDRGFTFQDPNQALAAGASIDFPLDMLNHDILIFAIRDSSGNNINVDIFGRNPTTLFGPYLPFEDAGVDGGNTWTTNKNTTDGTFYHILSDTSNTLSSTWRFFKIEDLLGTQMRFLITSNEGANAGTISTAYLRIV